MSACRSCRAPVVFAAVRTTGKVMPFERDAAGEWSVDETGIASHVGKAPTEPVAGVETVQRWTSHFARCPQASQWRRRK